MARTVDLENRLKRAEAAIAGLEARPDPTDQGTKIAEQDVKIRVLEDRIIELEKAGKNGVFFDDDEPVAVGELPAIEKFKNIGDIVTDTAGRWFRRYEAGVKLWREDWVDSPPET